MNGRIPADSPQRGHESPPPATEIMVISVVSECCGKAAARRPEHFPEKACPDLIRGGHRFSAENATS
jgi:hypothetical protein